MSLLLPGADAEGYYHDGRYFTAAASFVTDVVGTALVIGKATKLLKVANVIDKVSDAAATAGKVGKFARFTARFSDAQLIAIVAGFSQTFVAGSEFEGAATDLKNGNYAAAQQKGINGLFSVLNVGISAAVFTTASRKVLASADKIDNIANEKVIDDFAKAADNLAVVIASKTGADDIITVFRGDRPGTNVIKSKAAREGGYAHSQRVIDEGNLDDLFFRHQNSSDLPPSPFISATTDRRVAEFFAGPNGVVNEFRIPRSRATPNPFNNKLVPGPDGRLIPESEFLVPNYIRLSEFLRRPGG